jgi:hypothetical protein
VCSLCLSVPIIRLLPSRHIKQSICSWHSEVNQMVCCQWAESHGYIVTYSSWATLAKISTAGRHDCARRWRALGCRKAWRCSCGGVRGCRRRSSDLPVRMKGAVSLVHDLDWG